MKKVLYILGELSDQDIDWLISVGHVMRVGNGEVLIRKGQPSTELYVVLNGSLSAVINEESKDLRFEMGAGEIIGEISFVDSRPPAATVYGTEAAQVLAIPRPVLLERLQEDDGFAARFYKALAVFLAYRLRDTESLLNPQGEDNYSELDDNLTDRLFLAGKRFEQILKAVQG
jgi:CRP/FNR family cyclic AMP-dependent transcriptional regulator